MASHDLEHQPQERLITEIADLKNQIKELRTLQVQGTAAVGMAPTGVWTSTSAPILNTNGAVFMYTLSNTAGKMIFATFQFTLYQGTTADDAHAIGHPSNLLGFGYKWSHWTDWQAVSDVWPAGGYLQKDYVYLENLTGSTQTVMMKGEWRYIVNGGTVVVS